MATPYEKFIATTLQLVDDYNAWCQDLYERIDEVSANTSITELEQIKHEVSACIEFGHTMRFQAHKKYHWLLMEEYLNERCTRIREDRVKEGVDGVGSLRPVFQNFYTQKDI